MSREPFVTKKIAAGHMIQRSRKHGYWLTPEGTWHPSIFEGAAFKKRQDAERVLTDMMKQQERTHRSGRVTGP